MDYVVCTTMIIVLLHFTRTRSPRAFVFVGSYKPGNESIYMRGPFRDIREKSFRAAWLKKKNEK